MSVIAVVVVGIMGGDVEGKRVSVNAVVVVGIIGIYTSTPANFRTTAICEVIMRYSFPTRSLGSKTILPVLSCSNVL